MVKVWLGHWYGKWFRSKFWNVDNLLYVSKLLPWCLCCLYHKALWHRTPTSEPKILEELFAVNHTHRHTQGHPFGPAHSRWVRPNFFGSDYLTENNSTTVKSTGQPSCNVVKPELHYPTFGIIIYDRNVSQLSYMCNYSATPIWFYTDVCICYHYHLIFVEALYILTVHWIVILVSPGWFPSHNTSLPPQTSIPPQCPFVMLSGLKKVPEHQLP